MQLDQCFSIPCCDSWQLLHHYEQLLHQTVHHLHIQPLYMLLQQLLLRIYGPCPLQLIKQWPKMKWWWLIGLRKTKELVAVEIRLETPQWEPEYDLPNTNENNSITRINTLTINHSKSRKIYKQTGLNLKYFKHLYHIDINLGITFLMTWKCRSNSNSSVFSFHRCWTKQKYNIIISITQILWSLKTIVIRKVSS